jgi:hypothetical protein
MPLHLGLSLAFLFPLAYTPTMAPSTPDDLDRAFDLYFNEMDRCVSAGCYFALLHVIFALPDVCAALESSSGTTSGERYQDWYRRYLNEPLLSPYEFYKLRCALLHQGQVLDTGRYSTYSFAVEARTSLHRYVVPSERNITLDPRQMVGEMKRAIQTWLTDLRTPANATTLAIVRGHMPSLVREQLKVIPGIGGAQFMVQSST